MNQHYIILRPARINGRRAISVQRMASHEVHSAKDPDSSGSIDVCVETTVLTPPIRVQTMNLVFNDWLFPE